MCYKVTICNKEIELGKCTMQIQEMYENILELQKQVSEGNCKKRKLVESMLEYVETCIGEQNAKDTLDYTDIDDIDVVQLEIAVRRISDAYTSHILNDQAEQVRRVTKQISNSISGNNWQAFLNAAKR